MHSQLNSFSREISRYYDSYFEEFGLATSYIELLLLVESEGGLSQKDLSDKMNLAPSTITRFIRKLQKEEYVKKSRDGRLAKIIISDGAKNRLKKMNVLYDQAGKDLKKMLGKKYVDTTSRLLSHGVDQFREQD